MEDPKKPRIRHVELRIFFSLVCLLVVVARAVHPGWFDDALDYIPVGLAALPWLGFFVSEVKLPGGIEAKLTEIEQKVQVAETKAEAAQKEAAETKVETRMLAVTPEPGAPAAPGAPPAPLKMSGPMEDDTLARHYNNIRSTRPSGSARTAAMTGVVRAMVAAAASDAGADYSARAAAADEGLRLTAAAWAVAHPDRAAPGPLIDALYASTQPFVHYWLLMALDQIAQRQGQAVFSPAMTGRLGDFRPHAATGADRAYLLDSILRKLGQS